MQPVHGLERCSIELSPLKTVLFSVKLLPSFLRPAFRATVGPGSAALAAAFNWPVFVLRAQREGEQVLRCNRFDQQTMAGAGLCLMYTGDTGSESAQRRGAQGLFVEPSRGFSFPAAVSSLGEAPAPGRGSSPGSPAVAEHTASPTPLPTGLCPSLWPSPAQQGPWCNQACPRSLHFAAPSCL